LLVVAYLANAVWQINNAGNKQKE